MVNINVIAYAVFIYLFVDKDNIYVFFLQIALSYSNSEEVGRDIMDIYKIWRKNLWYRNKVPSEHFSWTTL